jgi:hypothetical protein
MVLLLLLALQDTETVPRGIYLVPFEEYVKAQQTAESDSKGAKEMIDRVFGSKINTRDRKILLAGPNVVANRAVDFFPHQARGRISMYLASKAPDADSAGKLVASAIADFKASADAGVKSSEKLLAAAEDAQRKLGKPAPQPPRPGPPPAVKTSDPAKEGPAEQAFREAWFKMIEIHRFKSARDLVETKGSGLPADKRREFVAETEDHCKKFVRDAQDEFLKAMELNSRPMILRGLRPAEFERQFALPPEGEVIGTYPALDWSRKEAKALDRLRQAPQRGKLEEILPALDLVLAGMNEAEPLERTAENRWLRESWQIASGYVEEILRGIVSQARESSPEARVQLRQSADRVRARWSDAISKIPREAMTRNGAFGRPKQMQTIMEEFPVDPSDVDRADLDACFTADSPDQALTDVISSLSHVREQEGARISRDASRKLLTTLIAATSFRDLLAGKTPEEVTRGVGDLGKALTQAGGPIDAGRWGPKIEKIFTSFQ